jgi:hypothetical protein
MEQLIKRKQSVDFFTRKKSLEEEIKLVEWLLACEHRRDMRNKIRIYLNHIQRELLEFLR